MTATNEAKTAYDDGLASSDNPYVIDTSDWCQWAKEFGRLNDAYMAKAISDDSGPVMAGDAKDQPLFVFGESTIEYVPGPGASSDFPFKRVDDE